MLKLSLKIKPLRKEALLKLLSYVDVLHEQICKETSIFSTVEPPTYYVFLSKGHTMLKVFSSSFSFYVIIVVMHVLALLTDENIL